MIERGKVLFHECMRLCRYIIYIFDNIKNVTRDDEVDDLILVDTHVGSFDKIQFRLTREVNWIQRKLKL